MRNKRVLVLGIALVLLASVVGIAFASWDGSVDRVYWKVIQGRSHLIGHHSSNQFTEIYNANDYSVRVTINLGVTYEIAAGDTIHLGGGWTVTRVVKR